MHCKSFFVCFLGIFNILNADTQNRLLSLSNKCLSGCSSYRILSPSFSPCACLNVTHELHCIYHHSWLWRVLYMCVSAFMCESNVNVLRRAHRVSPVAPGWRLSKFSVQRSAPVLLAGCVKHMKGPRKVWLMTRFPPLHVPLASL